MIDAVMSAKSEIIGVIVLGVIGVGVSQVQGIHETVQAEETRA